MRPKSAFGASAMINDTEENGAGSIDRKGGRLTIYLHPGQVFASSEPYVVTTILGSCVAVCLWDPLLGVGGINHYLLPYRVGDGQSSPSFGNVAVHCLIEKLLALGSVRRNLQAKLFGGGCVIEAFRGKDGHLGMKNVQVARGLLEDEGIPVVEDDVGGRQGRRLIFHVNDGTTWVKQL
ncbi:MAG: chemotaxis protein CheD [Candidatus Methylomirabilales bacterium]